MTREEMNKVVNEINEYMALKDELNAQIEALKVQAETYLDENGIDEYMDDNTGVKVTWRKIYINRFDTSSFRRAHEDLYKAFVKRTTSKRFTCN